jgi:exonuclease SbcC
MRLERLLLKGFLRFAGEVAIDLTALPPGLIALVGPNGSGKTTLLEAAPATLYRTFLSRGDLLDYATDADSVLEVQLATEGAGVFRARVHVDGVRRTSDAILEQLHADGSRTILNDGKVSTFDTVIATHFPDKSLLLASAFAAQNKAGSFITLDKRRRKELFLQLLGLERYQTMSDTARQAASLVDQARVRLVAELDLLSRDTHPTGSRNLTARRAT